MKNKIVKNYVYNLSYQILVLIIPLVTTPYLSRVLGANGIGLYSYTNSIIQYFILFGCIGLNLYGQREIAYVQHNIEERNRVFFELVLLRVITIAIALVLYYGLLINKSEYSYIFIIMTLEIIAAIFDISWFFQGIEEFKKVVIRNFIIKIVGVFLIFTFVKSNNDLIIYVLCHSLTILLGNLSMWLYIPKMVKGYKITKLHILKHIKPTLILFLPQIATSVYTILDKTMIGFFTGVEEVAYYEQAQKIIKIVLTLITSLGTVMLPRIANLFQLKQNELIKEYLHKSFRFVFFLSFPMMFGMMAISKTIVPWFFGEGYERVIPNMIIISPIIIFMALSNIIGTQYLLPTGKQKEITISVISGCIVNIFLNYILIKKLQSIGAAVASVIAELAVTCVQIFYVRKEFDFKKIILENNKYILCSFIMFMITYWYSLKVSSSILGTFKCVIVGVLVYCSLLAFQEQSIVNVYIKKAMNRFFKKNDMIKEKEGSTKR